jgi:hypothetical protein
MELNSDLASMATNIHELVEMAASDAREVRPVLVDIGG